MLRKPRYVLAVHSLKRSSEYYRDVLGFEVIEVGDPGWLFFVRDECFIMAGECVDAISPQDLGDHSYFAYIVVEGIDDFYRELGEKKATFISTLRNQPWGMREFGIRTIDGHRIMFGSPYRQA